MLFSDITTDFLINNYLFGIPLQDMYGNKMSNDLLQHYLNAAIVYTEQTLQIKIAPIKIVDEQHDYYQNDFLNWTYLQMYMKPISNVIALSMNFGNIDMFDIPADWIVTYGISGQIQLFPVSGSAGSLILSSNGSFLPITIGLYPNAPGIWKVSYTAGFTDVIPEDLVEFIMKRASIGILQVWGDLIIGAGIANQTLSIDGLSQSIGTTQSPEFSGAGARIKNYQDDMKELLKILKDTYVGINMGVI